MVRPLRVPWKRALDGLQTTARDRTGTSATARTVLSDFDWHGTRAVADEATIALLGCPHAPVELDLYTDFQKRQLRLVGAYQPCCPTTPTATYPWSQRINRLQVLDWIGNGALDVDTLLNDVVAPSDVGGLYQRLMQQGSSIAGGIDWTK